MCETQTKFPRSKVIRERYIVDELLGQGGFGAVYRIRDRRVKSNVFALKEIVDPNEHQRECFTFEGELLQHLDHPSLPRVYRVFEDEKHYRLYMLMDYIDGPNLERLRIQQPERRLSFAQTLKIMTPIIEAVAYLHSQTPPIIHRDIKPANIIVPVSGESAVLVDFGIAKEYDQNATTAAIRHCSPGYGAPEQYICDTNPRTDIYGLGATFYTLLTGEVPIDSLYRITSMSGKGTDPLVPLRDLVPQIPAPVADIIQRALAINSYERFTSVEAFWEALKKCESGKVSDFLPLDVPPGPPHLLQWAEPSDAVSSPTKQPVPPDRSDTIPLATPTSENVGDSTRSSLSLRPILGGYNKQVTGTRHKHRQMFFVGFVSLIILTLSIGAIFATNQWFRRIVFSSSIRYD
jgi:serine/threonine protein kinase